MQPVMTARRPASINPHLPYGARCAAGMSVIFGRIRSTELTYVGRAYGDEWTRRRLESSGPRGLEAALSAASINAGATGLGVTPPGPGRSSAPRGHRRCRTVARRGRCGDLSPPRLTQCDRYWPARPIAPESVPVLAEAFGWSHRPRGADAPIVRRGGDRSGWVGWALTQEVGTADSKSVALSPHRSKW